MGKRRLGNPATDRLLDRQENPHAAQRIPPDRGEVVVHANGGNAELLLPDAGNQGFEPCAGRDVARLGAGRGEHAGDGDLVELTDGIPRQSVEHEQLPWNLEGRDPRLEKPAEVVRSRRALEHDGSRDILAKGLVRNGHRGRLGDRGMAQKRVVHLPRVDLLAAPVDELLDPARKMEIARGIEKAHVAGQEPAVAKGLLVRLGVVLVARKHIRAADGHLADELTVQYTARRRRSPGHDPDLGPARRPHGARHSFPGR